LAGGPTVTTVDPVISVNVEGFLPDDYVPEVNQRLALYKRLAGAADEAEVADLRAELADRFGPLPAPAEQLLDIVRLRVAPPRVRSESRRSRRATAGPSSRSRPQPPSSPSGSCESSRRVAADSK